MFVKNKLACFFCFLRLYFYCWDFVSSLEPNTCFTLEIYFGVGVIMIFASWVFVIVFTSQLIKNNETTVYINIYKNN